METISMGNTFKNCKTSIVCYNTNADNIFEVLSLTTDGKILVNGEETNDDKVIADAVRRWAASLIK